MITTRDVPSPIYIPKDDRVPSEVVVSTRNVEDVKEAQEDKAWKTKVQEITEMRTEKEKKVKAEAEAKEAKEKKAKEKREAAAKKREEVAKKKKD